MSFISIYSGIDIQIKKINSAKLDSNFSWSFSAISNRNNFIINKCILIISRLIWLLVNCRDLHGKKSNKVAIAAYFQYHGCVFQNIFVLHFPIAWYIIYIHWKFHDDTYEKFFKDENRIWNIHLSILIVNMYTKMIVFVLLENFSKRGLTMGWLTYIYTVFGGAM